MSRPDTTPSGARPRPVVWYGAFVASVGAFLGFAGLTDLMPRQAIAWVALIGAVVTAGGAVLVQSTVTPLSSPQDARSVPLVALDSIAAQPTQAPPAAAVPEAPPVAGRPGVSWTEPPGRPDYR